MSGKRPEVAFASALSKRVTGQFGNCRTDFRCSIRPPTSSRAVTRRLMQCSAEVHPPVKTAIDPVDSSKSRWRGMTLHFISLEISRDGRGSKQLHEHILEKLAMEGDPVRWAIVAADEEKGTCCVDAVVSRYGQEEE